MHEIISGKYNFKRRLDSPKATLRKEFSKKIVALIQQTDQYETQNKLKKKP